MATRSDQRNPEQKTQNGHNAEFSNEFDPVVEAKQNNREKSQPQKSKQSE